MYFLKGTPFIYQGQEIGMTNLNVNNLDEFVDIETHNVLTTMHDLHLPEKFIDKSIRNGSRDNSRTPMQWDDSKYAGFSSSKPWLMVNNNKDIINVAKSQKDSNSILNYYKKLLKTYKEFGHIVKDGVYKDLCPLNKNLFVYERKLDNEVLLVISNFSKKNQTTKILSKYQSYRPNVLLNNYKNFDCYNLAPYQSVLLHLKKKNGN